jgi:hypothetical protein
MPVLGSGEAVVDAFGEGKYILGSLHTLSAVLETITLVRLVVDGLEVVKAGKPLAEVAKQMGGIESKYPRLPSVLASFVVGFQYHIGWLYIDCTYARPLYRNKEWGELNKKEKVYMSCNLHIHEC